MNMRRIRNYSQAKLAEAASVPRSTISHIESGEGNPSLSTLARVAAALQVGLDELISPPRSEVLLVKAGDVPREQRSEGRVTILKLLPDRVRGLEIDRMEFAARSVMKGTPHVVGTKEYLHVLKGTVQVLLAGQFHQVRAGDVLAFAGNQPHSYRNGEAEPAVAISVVVPAMGG